VVGPRHRPAVGIHGPAAELGGQRRAREECETNQSKEGKAKPRDRNHRPPSGVQRAVVDGGRNVGRVS
jgi:hypothetical protein